MNLHRTISLSDEKGVVYTTSFAGNRIKFGILLTLQLCSLPCFLYVLWQFARRKRLRGNIHHHTVLLLLIVSFLFVTVNLPFTLTYLYQSKVNPATKSFCTFWNWFHYSLNIINLFLMAFASLERNGFIFYPQLTKSRGGRLLFHYCPLIFCLVFPPAFYFAAIFIHKCVSYYDYTQLLCKWPCYFYNARWANMDTWLNNYAPLFFIPLFCGVLYSRMLAYRHALRQRRSKWRRNTKLTFQLWALSTLYLAMWMPLQISTLINLYWLPTFLLQAQIDYMYLFPYLIHLLSPSVVFLSFYREMTKPQLLARVHP